LAVHDHLADNDRRNQEGHGSNCKGFKHTHASAAANARAHSRRVRDIR
jgi:hypothetical protein